MVVLAVSHFKLTCMYWSVPAKVKLAVERWGDHAVVYNSLSGETHYINELAIEVLALLQNTPETLASLGDKICLLFEVDDRSALQQQLSQLIIEFDNLGLIEATKCEN